jgi:hypothetical protein
MLTKLTSMQVLIMIIWQKLIQMRFLMTHCKIKDSLRTMNILNLKKNSKVWDKT